MGLTLALLSVTLVAGTRLKKGSKGRKGKGGGSAGRLLGSCSDHGMYSVPKRACVCDAGWMGRECNYIAFKNQKVKRKCFNPAGSDNEATCQWYWSCLMPRFPACKTHALEYATSYGGKYCQSFTDNSESFSEYGQTWINGVKLCLQENLAESVMNTTEDDADCTKIRKLAFDSHPRCYTAPLASKPNIGICQMMYKEPRDVVRIFQITWDALFSRESIKQIVSVAGRCGVRGWKALLRTELQQSGYDEVLEELA